MRYLKLLGPLQVTQIQDDADEEVGAGTAPHFRSKRTVALLGYLAAERRAHAREHLATLFWPDDPPAKGRSNLRRELYNLNQVLPGCWQADSQTLCFVPTAETSVDIDALGCLVNENRWQEAADLLAGEFLEGLYLDDILVFETWLLAERERWREQSQAILQGASEEMIHVGRYADALPYARLLLRLTPWGEDAHRHVMRLLAWADRREEALRQYALCQQVLVEELGVEPSPETEVLYRQIQAGELASPPVPPSFLVAGAKNGPAELAERLHGAHSLFVLREREMAWLNDRLEKALSGRSGVAFVTGSPGQGKTALLEAFAAWALAVYPDLLIARGNCAAYAGVGDPYLPFRDIMAMLCGDVESRWVAGSISAAHARSLWRALPLVVQALLDNGPRLLDKFVPGPALLERAKTAVPAGAPWLEQLADQVEHGLGMMGGLDQSALFEQVSNVLRSVAAERPLLLLLDDIQWMDAASTGLLFHLVRRIADSRSRILILCAYRPQEIMRDQSGAHRQLVRVLSEFKRMFGDVWLGLSWADEEEGQQFVNSVLDSQPNDIGDAFRAALFQRTAGHPLFTIELLRAMRERGYLVRNANGDWCESPELDWQLIPARVEAVIEARIQQLEPQDQELLSVASVEGEQFTAQVLAQIQNLEERLLLRLLSQELGTRHRLVQEQEAYRGNYQDIARFGFRHTMFQEYLYKRLGQAERRMLHGAVAAALEKVYADDLEAMSLQLAQHYDRAGDDGRALHYYTVAAGNAARIYAFEEAIAHYTRALALANVEALREASQQTSDSNCARLYCGRGLAYRSTGQFDLARADLDSALDLSRTAQKPRLEWRVLIELGKLWASRDYNQARGYLEQALGLAQRLGDPTILGRTLNRMGNWHANDENPATAVFLHKEALRIFDELDDRPNLANTLDLLGIVNLLGSDYSTGVSCYNRSIELFRELGDYPRLISSLMGRAITSGAPMMLAVASAPAPRDPFADVSEAVQIARRIGSSPDEAWSSWAMALLHTMRGEFSLALEAGQRGLKLAASIQHREWQVGNHYALGVTYNELLQPETALQELEPALALAGELQSRYWMNHVTAALAQSYLLLDDKEAALRCLTGVLSEATPMDTAGRRYCWARRAELALAMDDPARALSITRRLIDSVVGLQAGEVVSFLWLIKGQALAKMGRLDEARELLLEGRDHTMEAQERFLLWRFHAALADLYQSAGGDSAAAEETAAARLLIEEMAATVSDEALAESFRSRAFAIVADTAANQRGYKRVR